MITDKGTAGLEQATYRTGVEIFGRPLTTSSYILNPVFASGEMVKKLFVVRLDDASDNMFDIDVFCAVYASSALQAGKFGNEKYPKFPLGYQHGRVDLGEFPEVELVFDVHGISNVWLA